MKRSVRILCYAVLMTYALGSYAFGATKDEFIAKLKAMKPKDYPTQPIEFLVGAPPGEALTSLVESWPNMSSSIFKVKLLL